MSDITVVVTDEVISVTVPADEVINVVELGVQGPVGPQGDTGPAGDTGPPGTTDHGSLTGLADDDHTQYHNNTRGDARYYTKTLLDGGQLDNRYYTETEVNNALLLKIDASTIGAASGVAPLGIDSKVPSLYLPSFVDDVLEYANLAAFPVTGSVGVIYVALDTNIIYRWGGSSYTVISPSPGSTDEVAEGSVNKYFTNARAQAAMTGAISSVVTANLDPNKALISNPSGKIDASGTSDVELSYLIGTTSAVQTQLDNITVSLGSYQLLIQPSNRARYYRGDKTWALLTPDAVNLGEVDNTSDLDKPISDATQIELNKKITQTEAMALAWIFG
jgi:hypothetical protein